MQYQILSLWSPRHMNGGAYHPTPPQALTAMLLPGVGWGKTQELRLVQQLPPFL